MTLVSPSFVSVPGVLRHFSIPGRNGLRPLEHRAIFQSCPRRSPQSGQIKGSASPDLTFSEPVLEGDLILYRGRNTSNWAVAAVIDVSEPEQYRVRPVHARTMPEEGNIECFVNWEPDIPAKTLKAAIHDVVLVDADYEERVVQDRVENPHGEMSEDCWRVSVDVLDSFHVSIAGP